MELIFSENIDLLLSFAFFIFSLSGYVQENEEKSSLWSEFSEVDNRLSDSQVSLYRPRQVKKLGHYELENFVDIYVVRSTWEEKGCFHCLCICPRLHKVVQIVTFLALQNRDLNVRYPQIEGNHIIIL